MWQFNTPPACYQQLFLCQQCWTEEQEEEQEDSSVEEALSMEQDEWHIVCKGEGCSKELSGSDFVWMTRVSGLEYCISCGGENLHKGARPGFMAVHGRWFKADDIRRVTQELEKKDASHETCKAEQAAIWDGPIDWVWEEWEADAAWDAGPCYLNPSSVHVDDD